MALFEKKEIKLISKLNKLTSKNELQWVVVDAPSSLTISTDHNIPLFFKTSYENKTVVIFQRNYRSYSDEFDETYWDYEICLGIMDSRNRVIWEYSPREATSALNDLFQSVRNKTSGVEDLLSNL